MKRKKTKYSCEEPLNSMIDNNETVINSNADNTNKKSKCKKTMNNMECEKTEPSVLQKLATGEMEEAESNVTTPTFYFEKPSIGTLEEICVKLNIEYRNRAEKLWEQIIFNQIDTVSPPSNIETHKVKIENFYKILSLFFTGKRKHHEKIQANIIDAFREKMVSSGLFFLVKY
uniref:Uncharacterized protein n=1 Tax=Panagrolaimus sp. ES5 TaxID=591445 RepID=A0AC34G2S1_9BILA